MMEKNKDIFYTFAQDIDCGVLSSTHNLCFGAKRKKKEKRFTPVHPNFTV